MTTPAPGVDAQRPGTAQGAELLMDEPGGEADIKLSTDVRALTRDLHHRFARSRWTGGTARPWNTGRKWPTGRFD